MRKRLLIFSFLILAVAGYTGAWFYAGNKLENQVERLLEEAQQKGWRIHYKAQRLTGFPFSLTMILDQPEFSYKQLLKTWVEGEMRFGAALWQPTKIHSWAAGKHHINVMLADENVLSAQGEGFEASWFLQDKGGLSFSYDQLHLGEEGSPLVRLGGVDVKALQHTPEDAQDPFINIQISLRELTAPALRKFPFGETLQHIHLSAGLTGTIEGMTLRERMNNWYESDGTLEVSEVKLQWGPLDLVADGTTTVDEDLQPMAAFSAHVGGLDETLTAFVQAQWLDQKVARYVRFGLGFLSEAHREDETSARHQLPLTVQAGRLFIGPVALAKVPHVEWE